jgi:CheY-like chemotaxis protein
MALQNPVMILVIDDNPSFARALAALLRRDGATVDVVDNGAHALARLQEQRYDVLLCNLQMPELDGPAFYDILTSQYPSLRQGVIFLTGDTLRPESMTFLAQCGQPWVQKPCTIAAIRSAIAQVLHAAALDQTLRSARQARC